MKQLSKHAIDLVAPSSTALNDVTQEVPLQDISSAEIQNLIDRMFEIAEGGQGNPERPTMVGLAAPQLGVNKRIILVGVDAEGNGKAPTMQAFINPVITFASAETVEGREGCYSTSRVCGVVDRAQSVNIKAYDRAGKPVELEVKDFPARIFQHEIDHLDGIRFPDHITDPARLHWVPIEQFGDYRTQWATWRQRCSPEKWLAIKTGQNQTTAP